MGDHGPQRRSTNIQDVFSDRGGGSRNCLVEGFGGRVATQTVMKVHFIHQHVRDTVIILE